jgi:DNA-binding SARP family transcriptional activator
MMTSLAMQLFGTPMILMAGSPVNLPTRKALALLIYLALEPAPHTRDELAALFWADSGKEQGRASLRQTLAHIRRSLPNPPVLAEREVVGLDPDVPIRVDVWKINDLYNLVVQTLYPRSTSIPHLRDTLALVNGSFMTGFSLPDAPEFDYWVSRWHERTHQQVVKLYTALAQLELDGGAIEDGLAHCERWLAFDGLDEAAYQYRMRFQLARGDRIGALQTYQQCEAMLQREFGLEPEARTKSLAQQAQATRFAAEPIASPEAECIALNRLATTIAQSRYDQVTALDLLRQAYHFAQQANNPLLLAETEWNLAQTCLYMCKLEQALQHGERAITLARQIKRAELLGRALNVYGFALFMVGRPLAEVARYAEEGEQLLRGIGLNALAADCQMLKVYVLIYMGWAEAALELSTGVYQFGLQSGNDWAVASAAYNMALAYLDMGDSARAMEIVQEGLLRAQIAGHPPLIFFNQLVVGIVQRSIGDVSAALGTQNGCYTFQEPLANPFINLLVTAELCVNHALLGQWEAACQWALEARLLRSIIPYPGFAAWLEIEALLRGGHSAEARQDVEAMRATLSQRPDHHRLRATLLRIEMIDSHWWKA